MTPEQREKLVEDMAKAVYRAKHGATLEYPWDILPDDIYKDYWGFQRQMYEFEAEAALAVAEQVIRDDALEEAAAMEDTRAASSQTTAQELDEDGAFPSAKFFQAVAVEHRECATRIRAMKGKAHEPS